MEGVQGMVVEAGTRGDCGRCGGRVIVDAREGERYCLTCGDRPVTEAELLEARRMIEVEAEFYAGKRYRSPSIGGLRLA